MDGLQIFDTDGLNTHALMNKQGIAQPAKQEEKKPVATGNGLSLDDPFDPSAWGLSLGQTQQQAPTPPQVQVPQQQQLVMAKADPNNPQALPKDQQTLDAMINKGVYNTLGTLAQINAQKNNRLQDMRNQMMKSEGYAPWMGVAEEHYNNMVNMGAPIEQAAASAITHVQSLHRQGCKPPERTSNSLIPNQYSGYGSQNFRGSEFRPDEGTPQMPHFTDEDKIKRRDEWIHQRHTHLDWVKSGGLNGMSYQEMKPEAFNRRIITPSQA